MQKWLPGVQLCALSFESFPHFYQPEPQRTTAVCRLLKSAKYTSIRAAAVSGPLVGPLVWPMLDRTCHSSYNVSVTGDAACIDDLCLLFDRIMVAVIIALGLALLQKEAGIVVFLSCCLVMVHSYVLMSQMSEAASLIPNCSAYKHDSSCPHTIIQADSSALSSIRTKAVVECRKVASEHFLFVGGAISS